MMFLVNTPDIPGRKIEALGLVIGSSIQTVNAFKDIGAGFKTLIGGEQKSYVKMLETARSTAIERMVDQARRLGADAIVNIRFSSSEIMEGSAEICVAGTAVKYV
ncbi:MAG: YbjQ family protein [bacterium]